MKKTIIFLLMVFFIIAVAANSFADSALFDWAYNIDGTVTEAPGDYDLSGMPVNGTLDPSGLGTLTWSTNVAGSHSFIAFFDHELSEIDNTYWNEYGTVFNTAAVTQSWEIDEPGWADVEPGDIYDNMLAGALDNTNSVPFGSEDDVSWAMGWDFTLAEGYTATINLILAAAAPESGFYLAQSDPESNETIYFSSTFAKVPDNPVPEPATILLLGIGLISLVGINRKKIIKS